jgi:hypothetical protein
MRYWAYFAAKIAVASLTLYGLLVLLDHYLINASNAETAATAPKTHAARALPPPSAANPQHGNAQRDVIWLVPGAAIAKPAEDNKELVPLTTGSQALLMCNVGLMVWFLLAAGVGYLIIWDQRYRCRTCLRRLRMPVETGSWGQMLQFGRPRMEYICVYGHGTLRAEELQISGREQPEWTPNSNDFWEELCSSGKDSSTRR